MDDELQALALMLAQPAPSSNTYGRGVRQLEEAITGTVPVPVARRSAGRSRSARPMLLAGAASAALAAVVAGGLVVASGTARAPGGGGSPAFTPASTATAVLRNAALAARAEPAATPRPDQFVYSKVYDIMTCRADRSTGVDQAWLSVSGTRAGTGTGTASVKVPDRGQSGASSGPACQGARVFPPSLTQSRALRCRPCTPADFAAYMPGMPTRPAALRAWLGRRYHVRPGSAGVIDLLGITDDLLATNYLTPAQHVAMFEMLTQTPGLKVVPKESTVLGGTGVGVRWTVRTRVINNKPVTDTFTLIFNRKTYRLLGMNWNLSGATGGAALIKLAIVNKPGQLP
jgi:hypothetical protein